MKKNGIFILKSARQIAVAKLWASGFSVNLIADTLMIENSTVKTHLRRIYAHTGCCEKREVLLYLLKTGICKLDEFTGFLSISDE